MSSQKFSAIQREAIWRAYDRKCAYTRALLDISSFHIDHIIPETLADTPEQLKETLEKCGRDATFDLFDWENLVPAAPGANLQKSSHVFDPAAAMFYLGIAAIKKPEVLKELVKVKKRAASSRALVMIQQLLESGKLTPEQAAEMINKGISQPQEMFTLLESVGFSDLGDVDVVARSDIEQLRDRPVKIGPNDHIDGVELTGTNDEKRFCRTCREYDTAKSEGFYPLTNFDIKISTWFEQQCGLLTALQAAQAPSQSFVSDPRVGVVDLNLLPYSFFPVFTEHTASATTESYQDKVDDGTLVVKRVRANMLTIESPDLMGQVLIEVVRADFNGDGIEDILLFEYCYAIGGTMSWGAPRLLTRTSDDAMFTIFNGTT